MVNRRMVTRMKLLKKLIKWFHNLQKEKEPEEEWIPSGRVNPNEWRNSKVFFLSDLDDWF